MQSAFEGGGILTNEQFRKNDLKDNFWPSENPACDNTSVARDTGGKRRTEGGRAGEIRLSGSALLTKLRNLGHQLGEFCVIIPSHWPA